MVTLSGRISRSADGRQIPDFSLVGPTSAATRVRLAAGTVAIGCTLTALGWMRLVETPAGEVADEAVAADGGLLRALVRAGTESATVADDTVRAGLLATVLTPLLSGPQPRGSWHVADVDRWTATPGERNVEGLAKTLKVSRKTLGKLTWRTHGGAPKLLACRARALTAARRMALGLATDWRSAGEGSFYDQSHFIRDFRRFIGVTPAAFLRAGPTLARAVVTGA